jgi:hypothetical protein
MNENYYYVEPGAAHLLIVIAIIIMCCAAYGGFVMGKEVQEDKDLEALAKKHFLEPVETREGVGWRCTCGETGWVLHSARLHLAAVQSERSRR